GDAGVVRLPQQQTAHRMPQIHRPHQTAYLVTVPHIAALEFREQNRAGVDLVEDLGQLCHEEVSPPLIGVGELLSGGAASPGTGWVLGANSRSAARGHAYMPRTAGYVPEADRGRLHRCPRIRGLHFEARAAGRVLHPPQPSSEIPAPSCGAWCRPRPPRPRPYPARAPWLGSRLLPTPGLPGPRSDWHGRSPRPRWAAPRRRSTHPPSPSAAPAPRSKWPVPSSPVVLRASRNGTRPGSPVLPPCRPQPVRASIPDSSQGFPRSYGS